MNTMNDAQIERYSRNIILKEVGGKGQEKLLQSKVLIIGAGGLGAPAALYLAAAGVGTIGIVDGDRVDLSNLQRQVIHFTDNVGVSKVDSAREKIKRLNPDVRVIAHKEMAFSHNIAEIIGGYDFVIDGTDNFPAKFLINDACVLGGKPLSHAGILRFDGQTITVLPNNSACVRCLFIAPPPAGAVPSCSQAGVIGGMAGVIGTIQALEAIKFLLGLGDLLTNRLLVFEALAMRFREVKVGRNPDCPVCGENPTVTSLIDYEQRVCDLKR
ncbi:MAG: putative adenylyltransferase/sulfurtransferase MoeZ [Syntrophorhabdaceae bacterium PtaU1.Bin034]|jgi:adenylyltransferase/sulfurtransferase|nr:MAG: putative adenylyltransferase/sulfurtransferase MoeZ [Syntrophorhabdaceae bacterium PtaU1.Bin034]